MFDWELELVEELTSRWDITSMQSSTQEQWLWNGGKFSVKLAYDCRESLKLRSHEFSVTEGTRAFNWEKHVWDSEIGRAHV